MNTAQSLLTHSHTLPRHPRSHCRPQSCWQPRPTKCTAAVHARRLHSVWPPVVPQVHCIPSVPPQAEAVHWTLYTRLSLKWRTCELRNGSDWVETLKSFLSKPSVWPSCKPHIYLFKCANDTLCTTFLTYCVHVCVCDNYFINSM